MHEKLSKAFGKSRGAGVDRHPSSKEQGRVDPAKRKEGIDGPGQSWDAVNTAE